VAETRNKILSRETVNGKSNVASFTIANPKWAVLSDYLELAKPRLLALVLITVVAGFFSAASGEINIFLLINAVVGTGLLVGGAGALNQYIERNVDAKMHRTQRRPLPDGRINPRRAMLGGLMTCIFGLGYLWIFCNTLSAALGLLATLIYLLLYTPMKQRTTFNTWVGALSGALPPLIGAAAVNGELPRQSLCLFLIVFIWQLPHFIAIAWLHRDDYNSAGMKMIGIAKGGHKQMRVQLLVTAGLLVAISFLPSALNIASTLYNVGAILLGMFLLVAAANLAARQSQKAASKMILASVIYLGVLLSLFMIDKIFTDFM